MYATAGFFGVLILAALVLSFRRDILTPEGAEAPETRERLRVVATFFPLYDFARAVGGEEIELTILFTQTPEVASFAPLDVQKINRADLVIKNGLGFEPVLDELIAASDNRDVAVADTSIGIQPLGADEGVDPHIWLNPINAAAQARAIRDALIARDPAHADTYTHNADAYIVQLASLDRDIENIVAGFARRDFVAFHSAFRSFAARYGLRPVAVIEEFPGKEPSPRYITEVIKIIRETGTKAIFSEPQFSPRIVEVIARDLGLTVYALDPIETGDPAQDSYLSLMRRNLETLKTALQ